MAAAPHPLPEVLAAGWSEHRLERPQGGLRYVEAGEGPWLLLCHGFIGSAENFESWVPRLALRRRLLIPDLPGFGGSAPLPGAHSSRALALEVLALLDQLQVGEIDLGGLCLGASVALEVLAQRPRAVRRLLLHTPLLDPGSLRRGFRAQVALATLPGAFDAISWAARRRRLADLYRRLVVEGSGVVDRRAAEVNFENQLRAFPRAAREWLRLAVRQDYRDLVRNWRGPVGILAAAEDRILDLPRLRRFCRARVGTELEVMEESGHGWDPELISGQLEILERYLELPAAAEAG